MTVLRSIKSIKSTLISPSRHSMRPTERFHFRTNFLSPRCPFSTVSPRYFNFPREFVQSLWIVRLASDFPWQSRLRGAIRTRDNRANRSHLADPPAPLYRLNISSLHARRQIFLRAFSLLSRFRPRTSASSRSRKNLRRRTKQEIKETSEARFDKQFLLVAEGETEGETGGERRARERVGASGRKKTRMRAVDEDKTHSTQYGEGHNRSGAQLQPQCGYTELAKRLRLWVIADSVLSGLACWRTPWMDPKGSVKTPF